ncbi:hypothetical protein GF325_00530 [Candidatus Bathyarchaeota archaeon]|nr:hypothetical protein [Candidatus Bathyarchaeota archaeon]
MSQEDFIAHIIITGSRQAGISSFISQKAKDFEPHDEVGWGIDIQTTSVNLDDECGCTMHFYEIAGTFPLDSLRKILRKKNVGLAIMFDLSNKVSIELAELLYKRIEEKLNQKSMPSNKFLLGSHLDEDREVTREEIDALITIMGEDTHYLEFSSKTGENLEESLQSIAKIITSR